MNFILNIAIMLLSIIPQYDNIKTIQVTDPSGKIASNVTLYVMDDYSCQQYQTDRAGIAKIDVQQEMFVIYASDLSGQNRYGVSVFSPNYSSKEYQMEIPYFPNNQNEVGIQIDKLFENLRLAFDLGSVADLLIAIKNGAEPIIPSQLGVPGVFSINPIPKKMSDGTGRLGIEISGVLLKPIMTISAKIPGRQYVYGHSGSF